MNFVKHSQTTPKGVITWFEMGQKTTTLKTSIIRKRSNALSHCYCKNKWTDSRTIYLYVSHNTKSWTWYDFIEKIKLSLSIKIIKFDQCVKCINLPLSMQENASEILNFPKLGARPQTSHPTTGRWLVQSGTALNLVATCKSRYSLLFQFLLTTLTYKPGYHHYTGH